MTLSILPIIVAVIGLALFCLTNGKASTVGDRMFFAGLIAALLAGGAHSISIH